MSVGRMIRVTGLLVSLSGLTVGCTAENGLTRAQGDEILAELKAIHATLEQTTKTAQAAPAKAAVEAPTVVHISTVGGQAQGKSDAPLTLVEFTDFQCPFCRRFQQRTWADIKKNYVDTGKLRYLVLDLPLPFHEQARPSAIAAHCAAEQGDYWPMHDKLFALPDGGLTAQHLREAAIASGANGQVYDTCVTAQATATAVDASLKIADAAGLTGTPSFVLGRAHDDKVDGTVIVGAQPYEVFASRIDAALAAPPK